MKKEMIFQLTENFENFSHKTDDGVEFWLARDLQHLLNYSQWRNFVLVIAKAKTACELSGQNIDDHFADISKTIKMLKIDDLMLSRGIVPENIPPEEDVKKLARRLNKEKKQILKK